MSEWFDSQKQSISRISKLLQERIKKANPRRDLTAEETKRFAKLEAMADKLNRGENVQSSDGVAHYLHTNYGYVVNVCY